MNTVKEFAQVRSDIDHMFKLTCALEAYGEILKGQTYEADSSVGQAIQLGLESIDPSIDLKEGSYITLRAIKEGIIKVAKATREALRVLFELINSLYVKFTGSLGRVRSQQKNISHRLGKLGSRVSYKQMEVSGINRLSVNGSFVGDRVEYLKEIRNVAEYLLVQHPAMLTRVARVCSRRFIDLVEHTEDRTKLSVAQRGMELFVEALNASMRPIAGQENTKRGELPPAVQEGHYVRSQVMPGNWALVYTDLSAAKRSTADPRSYASVIRNAFYIDYIELPLNTADRTARQMDVPDIRTLKGLIDGVSNILDVAEKAESGRRDFATVKVVVDDAIRQVMNVKDTDGTANNVVIQMLGSISETLAAPMGNFTHWVAVTMNVYLNFIDHCIKHYEAEGV